MINGLSLVRWHNIICVTTIEKLVKIKNSLVHVRDEKVSLYRHFQNFSSHDSAI